MTSEATAFALAAGIQMRQRALRAEEYRRRLAGLGLISDARSPQVVVNVTAAMNEKALGDWLRRMLSGAHWQRGVWR